MEPNRQAKTASSLPVIGMFAIISLAFYVSQRPLESSRPKAPAGLRHLMEEEGKIDSRLWQDPLKVALEHEEALHGEGKAEDGISGPRCRSPHCVSKVSEQISDILREKNSDPNNPRTIVHILLTMVRSGLYAEDHERRLRNRYAVLTALHTSAFAPEDPEHIRYFKLPWAETNRLENNIEDGRVPEISEVCDNSPRVLLVPFEWFEREELYSRVCGDTLSEDPSEYVLVVWLAEDDFSSLPLTRLAQVIDKLGYANCSNVRVDMIGPSYSGTLGKMVRQVMPICRNKDKPVDSDCVDVDSMLAGLTICSAWSTASPAMLIEDWPGRTLNENSISTLYEVIPREFKKIDVNFVPMIGSDDLLAVELIEELGRRGVDVIGRKDCVALISGWDRFYSKAFPRMFATMMKSYDPNSRGPYSWNEYAVDLNRKMESSESYFPENLLFCSYIRGIDGRLPEAELLEEKRANEDVESQSKRVYTRSPELPTGRSQLDYIRRLAQKMDDEHEVKAFGVVGTDVYDKLLLLQALREQLGDVILFTIDLDARMMHHEQFEWTRNIIVASNYGLELNDHYQRAVYQEKKGTLPAFRDNYQTALFFACRTALGLRARTGRLFRDMQPKELTEVISHPRLFEIGRGRAVDLSVENADIHPRRDKYPPWRPFLLCALVIVTIILLLYQVSQNVQKMLRALVLKPKALQARALKKIFKANTWKAKTLKRTLKTNALKLKKIFKANTWKAKTLKRTLKTNALKLKKIFKPKTWNWYSIGVNSAVFAVILFVALTIIDHYRPTGEPFSLVAGVSIWPGEALRLVAAILSVWFIAKSLRDLRANERRLCEWFNPEQPDQLRQSGIGYKQWLDDKKLCGWSKHRLDPRSWWRYQQERIRIHSWSTQEWKSIDAEQLWKDYLTRGILGKRIWRLTCMSVAYILLAAAFMFLLGGPPETPYRGNLSRTVDSALLILSVLSMIVLIFFVVDATKLSLRFIRNLKVPKTRWSERVISDFQQDHGEVPDGLEEWLDILFVARLTEAVGKLIYYPFIILLIMLVARNPYFDNWGFPLSLIVIFLLNSTCALCCAMMLRHEAEKARGVALGRLQRKLVRTTGAGDLPHTKQLEVMIEQIKSVRRGAYSPFTENPVLHAILIPSGGLSLLTLLRFLVPS